MVRKNTQVLFSMEGIPTSEIGYSLVSPSDNFKEG